MKTHENEFCFSLRGLTKILSPRRYRPEPHSRASQNPLEEAKNDESDSDKKKDINEYS